MKFVLPVVGELKIEPYEILTRENPNLPKKNAAVQVLFADVMIFVKVCGKQDNKSICKFENYLIRRISNRCYYYLEKNLR